MKYVLIAALCVLGVLGVLLAAAWFGLRVKPRPFPAYSEQTPALETVELRAGLPPPVSSFYKTISGDRVPVIESAVITMRGTLRFRGVRFPSRLRFIHTAGQDYRHYIEATLFGYPLMKVNELYLNGNARMELPVGVVENEPKVDMAANLGLWAESMWLPAIWVTDPRVRWEPIDDTTARLVVPFGEGEDTFTVSFDPDTGLIQMMEAMRYREATDEAKIPWRLEPLGWEIFHGIMIPSSASATWLDQGTPWLVVTVEDVAYNVDVSEYIKARGL